jgi:hypothetical protein
MAKLSHLMYVDITTNYISGTLPEWLRCARGVVHPVLHIRL